MLKSEHLHRFKTLYAISSKLSQFCFEVYKQIATYVDAKCGSKEEISLGIIQQAVYNKADEILEIAESSLWEGCLRTIKSLTNELNTTVTRVDNDNKMDKIATGVAPWIQRASDMKAEVVVSHDMERKLQQHSDEILKLIKDLKLKDQALQESTVKVELLEKRMVTVKKQAEQIATLEETLQKSQTQETMYAEAIENLQAEYDALEQENTKLKKATAAQEAKLQMSTSESNSNKTSANGKTDTSEDQKLFTEIEGSATSLSAYDGAGQVEALKAAIRYLKTENAHLKSRDLASTLKLDTLSTADPLAPTAKSANTELRTVAIETRVLIKDMRTAGASPKVVALHAERRGGKWQSQKKTPDYQYQTQQSVLYTLKQRSEKLRNRMEEMQLQPAARKDLAANNNIKSLQEGLSRTLAKIQIPALSSASQHRVQIKSAAEFERIHGMFLR
ncbi:hypothetical protein BDB00DRAFT_567556 [Zychaea mexicana]|uniref:uncharacterized protein n=1 Tax=Zychaea mexicana TaxID=64656 RepID=UPI0022FE8F6D|nr:uncharacterized protein BDB00DRAFT_567556 [Zychaea mexicana]KAI9490050.1 hypothetical protein BDB00DRAFT_567556 [Zychaea mexicana]